ncbi:MAG: ABC transporter permease subunit [Planctomycetes bacterium]|nr:ABC transporter permease subunit [Planctomycetota bacterium]
MNPMLERDFFTFIQTKRFFLLRGLMVGAPVVGMVLLATVAGNLTNRDEIGLSIFRFTTYPLLVLALLVSPAMLAHSIVEERTLNTLEVLRTTELTIPRIIFGKWASRFFLLLLVCVAALPLAASSLLFGGISPEQLLQFAAVLVASLFWVTSLTMLVSSVAKDVTTAMRTSILLVILGSLGTGVGAAIIYAVSAGRPSATVMAIANFLLQLNPVVIMSSITEFRNMRGMMGFGGVDPVIVYGVASTVCGVIFLFVSGYVLTREGRRPRTESQPEPGQGGPPRAQNAMKAISGGQAPWEAPARGLDPAFRGQFSNAERFRWFAKALDKNPAFWLDVNQLHGRRRPWVRVVGILLFGLLEVGFFYALSQQYAQTSYYGNAAARSWPLHAAISLGFLFMGMLVVMGVGAASFRRDADAKTQEVLFATPLTTRELTYGKIAGVLWGATPYWSLSVVHALVAMLLGAMSLISFLWFVAVSAVLVASAASFSMRCSLQAKNVLRANLFASGGFVLWMIVLPLFLGIFLSLALRSGGSDSGEFVTNLLCGWHPMYVAFVPFIASAPDNSFLRDNNGWWLTIPYSLAYLIFAGVTLTQHLYAKFKPLREGVA